MAITDGIITLDDALASLYGNPAPTATANDEDIERYIESATPVIENIVGPVIEREVTWSFDGGDCAINLPARVQAITSVEVDGVATTAYVADLTAGVIHALGRFAPGYQNVVVEATVGYADDEYPANVVLAARELVRFWWQQGRQGNRPAFGNEIPDTDSTPLGFLVPKRVMELLQATPSVGGFA